MKTAFITGSAGFIGFHVCKKLLSIGWKVVGIDGMTDYYDVELKKSRNCILKKSKNFVFKHCLLEDKKLIEDIFSEFKPQIVIHLAAQAGVRYSMEKPQEYVQSNIVGTFNILEFLKEYKCEHFLMASTSSIYGSNEQLPFGENDKCDSQKSIYAATKKAAETLSHTYSHLYDIPTTCFRFFTVYGPWGRPDMALFSFTEKMLNSEPIDVFNMGDMLRDFTFIDDLVEAISKLLEVVPSANSSKDFAQDSLSDIAPWRVVNIGNSQPRTLMDFITALENALNIKAIKRFLNLQPGDIKETHSDNSLLKDLTGFEPKTNLETGIEEFVQWYKMYKKIRER